MVDCGTLLDGHATRWCGHRERPSKPNIVLLLPDDVGWQDVKCYDIDDPSPMEPPNFDALAKKGVMFWQAYSPAPVCSPLRCTTVSDSEIPEDTTHYFLNLIDENHYLVSYRRRFGRGATPSQSHQL
jgi:hypothetical protein